MCTLVKLSPRTDHRAKEPMLLNDGTAHSKPSNGRRHKTKKLFADLLKIFLSEGTNLLDYVDSVQTQMQRA